MYFCMCIKHIYYMYICIFGYDTLYMKRNDDYNPKNISQFMQLKQILGAKNCTRETDAFLHIILGRRFQRVNLFAKMLNRGIQVASQ